MEHAARPGRSTRPAGRQVLPAPGLHEDGRLDYSLAIRTDILTKLDLQPPTTWDELTTVLREMKKAYPNVYPLSDRWSNPEGLARTPCWPT